MKTKPVLASIALILSSSLVLAAGQPQEQKAPQPDAERSAMGGGCMPMHDSMRTMHSQINEIYQAEDPDKRAELIEAHLDSMSQMMKMTKGMMDQGMDMPAGKTN